MRGSLTFLMLFTFESLTIASKANCVLQAGKCKEFGGVNWGGTVLFPGASEVLIWRDEVSSLMWSRKCWGVWEIKQLFSSHWRIGYQTAYPPQRLRRPAFDTVYLTLLWQEQCSVCYYDTVSHLDFLNIEAETTCHPETHQTLTLGRALCPRWVCPIGNCPYCKQWKAKSTHPPPWCSRSGCHVPGRFLKQTEQRWFTSLVHVTGRFVWIPHLFILACSCLFFLLVVACILPCCLCCSYFSHKCSWFHPFTQWKRSSQHSGLVCTTLQCLGNTVL